MASKSEKPKVARSRRPLIVCVLMGVLLAGTAIPLLLEYQARTAHEESFTKLNTALKEGNLNRNRELTLTMVDLLIEGDPDRQTIKSDGKQRELFEWNGLLGRYVIVLQIDPDRDVVTSMSTEGALFDQIVAANESATKPDTAETSNTNKNQTANKSKTTNKKRVARKTSPIDEIAKSERIAHSAPRPKLTPAVGAISQLMGLSRDHRFERGHRFESEKLFTTPPSELSKVPQKLAAKVEEILRATNWQKFPSPKAESNSKPQVELSEFMRRKMTIDAFQTHGSHNPSWDEPVIKFLETYVAQHTKEVRVPDIELVKMGSTIVATGCDDPLVLSIIAKLFHQSGAFERAVAILERVERKPNRSTYPARFLLGPRLTALDVLAAQSAPNASSVHGRQAGADRLALVVETIEAKDWDDDQRRYHLRQIEQFVQQLTPVHMKLLGTVLSGMRAPGDDWFWKMALAQVHFQYAWKIRGSGSGRSLSRARRRGFRIHMEVTRRLALEAWAERPDLPEAATLLIQTTTTVGGVIREPKRFWFVQAVKSDYAGTRPYTTLRWGTNRRWGGSHEELIRFARECLAGGRFDTNVPWQFHLTMRNIATELEEPNRIYTNPGVFEDYVRMFEGYAKHEGADRIAFRQSQIICVAYLAGRVDEARERWEKLGDKVDPDAFHAFGLQMALVERAMNPIETTDGRFRGYEGASSGLATVHGGRLLVTVGGGFAHVWDLKTGGDIGQFLDRGGATTLLVVAPDDELVATGDDTGRVVVWDAALRKELHSIQIVGPVHAIAFSRDGRYLATGGGDRYIRLWDLDDGRLAATFAGQGQVISSLAFSTDGRTLACTTGLRPTTQSKGGWTPPTGWGSLVLWDWKNRKITSVVRAFQQAAAIARYSNNGRYLAVAGWDRDANAQSVRVVDTKSGKVISKYDVNKVIMRLRFAPDDKTLFVAANDGVIRLLATETGELLARFVGHYGPVRTIAVTPDGSKLISGDKSGLVNEWDISAGVRSQVAMPLLESPLTEPRRADFCLKHGQRWLATVDSGGLTLWKPGDDYQVGLGFGGIGSNRKASAFDISPDESLVAVATWAENSTEGATVIVWNAGSGQVVRRISLTEPRCRQLRFSPDQKSIVVACGSRLGVWDIASDVPQRTSQTELAKNAIVNFSFSPDAQLLAVVRDDGLLSIANTSADSGWKAASPRNLGSAQDHLGIESMRLEWFPDSTRLVLSSKSKIAIWDVKAGRLIRVVPGSVAAISHDGQWLAASSLWNNDIRVLDAKSGKEVKRVQIAHPKGVIDLAWAPSGLLLSVGLEGTVRCWNPQTESLVLAPSNASHTKLNIQTTANNAAETTSPIIPASATSEVATGNSNSGTPSSSGSSNGTATLQQLRHIMAHQKTVYSLAISPDGRTIVSGGAGPTVKMWNAESGKLIQELVGHKQDVCSVSISPDGKRILSGSWDLTLRLWDFQTGKLIQTFLGHEWPVLTTAISPDGRRVLSGSDGFGLWDVETGTLIKAFNGHEKTVWSVAFSSSGKCAITGSADGTVRLWELFSGRELRRFIGHTGWVKCVRLSPDERYAVSCSTSDPNVRQWDLATGKQVRIFPHRGPVASIDFSADGRFLICALGQQDSKGKFVKPTNARGIRVWEFDKKTDKPLIQINDPVAHLETIAFGPKGTRAISGSGGGSLHVWSLLNFPKPPAAAQK